MKYKGFTLIELLIVITIIGILATFVVASFTQAQKNARDSLRKSDIDALKKALELAKSDSLYGSYYPICVGSPISGCVINNTNITTLEPTYIKKLPKDPSDPAGVHQYVYIPKPNACDLVTRCTSYDIYACMENPNNGITGPYSCNVGRTIYVKSSP